MQVRPTPLLLSAVAAVVSVAACSSVTVTSTISVEQACSELAMARCALRSNCSRPDDVAGVGTSVLELYGDLATCLAREALACTDVLSAPETGNDPAPVQMCVRAFMTYSCMDFFDNVAPVVCTPVGRRASGAPCTADAQCRTGTCNAGRNDACGTCGDPAGLGDDCSATECARGARCVRGTCAAQASSNEACDDTHPCDRGLSCVVAAGASSGTCESAGTRVGVACAGKMPGCDASRGLSCVGADGAKTCQSIVVAGPATPCGQLPDGSRVACLAGTCLSDGADMGSCVPFAADGDPCDPAAGPDCMPPARCVAAADGTAGTCVIPTATTCGG